MRRTLRQLPLLSSVLTDGIVVTNAAGSLKADVPVGTSAFNPRYPSNLNLTPPIHLHPHFPFPSYPVTVVVIDDHIALPLLTGLNPLRGPVSRPGAARFVPLSDAYPRPLRLAAFRAAHDLGLPRSALAEGAYAWVSGPTYETRGEAALLASAGASVVGMSTVPEVVAARDEGVRVLVLSLVTNMVVGVVPGTRGGSVREELDAEVRNDGHTLLWRIFCNGVSFFLFSSSCFWVSLLGWRWSGRLCRRCRMRRSCRSGS